MHMPCVLVLCRDIPPTLFLTHEQALTVVYKVIDWQCLNKDLQEWIIGLACYTWSFFDL